MPLNQEAQHTCEHTSAPSASRPPSPLLTAAPAVPAPAVRELDLPVAVLSAGFTVSTRLTLRNVCTHE